MYVQTNRGMAGGSFEEGSGPGLKIENLQEILWIFCNRDMESGLDFYRNNYIICFRLFFNQINSNTMFFAGKTAKQASKTTQDHHRRSAAILDHSCSQTESASMQLALKVVVKSRKRHLRVRKWVPSAKLTTRAKENVAKPPQWINPRFWSIWASSSKRANYMLQVQILSQLTKKNTGSNAESFSKNWKFIITSNGSMIILVLLIW